MSATTIKKLKRAMKITGKAARKMAKNLRRTAPNVLHLLTH